MAVCPMVLIIIEHGGAHGRDKLAYRVLAHVRAGEYGIVPVDTGTQGSGTRSLDSGYTPAIIWPNWNSSEAPRTQAR